MITEFEFKRKFWENGQKLKIVNVTSLSVEIV